MGYWLGIVFSCLDVLCVAVFCDAFLERKTRGLRFVVGALLCGVLSYIATVFVSHISEESPITLLKFAALITVYFVFASLLYTGKFWLRLLVVVLAYAISTLLEFCVFYSLLAWLHIRYDEYVANMKLYFASAAITYSLKFLLSSGIKKMQRYKEWWDTKKKLMGASWQRDMVTNKEDKRESLMKLVGQEFVIIYDFGWPRNPDGYNKLVKRVAQKAGISDIHPHMFRHTFVSLLMSNPDIGVATVAAEAGHAQPSTTLMIYTQQYKKRRESIRNQLSRELYEK